MLNFAANRAALALALLGKIGMSFLEKLQKKPEKIRNRIFWIALIVSVGIIGFFWIKSLGGSLEKLKFESGKIEKSSKDLMGEAKSGLPVSDLMEGVRRFEKFLKGEEFKKLFEEENQLQKDGKKGEEDFAPNENKYKSVDITPIATPIER